MNYATNKQYTSREVLDWMKNYRKNYNALQRLEGDFQTTIYAGGGTAQYGIESVMPNAQGGTSDKTFNDVMNLLRYKDSKVISNLYISVKYLEHRSSRIKKERHAIVYYYRISGYTSEDIAKVIGSSRTGVHNVLKEIAEIIIGDDKCEI